MIRRRIALLIGGSSRPWLAASVAAGAVWFLASFPLGFVAGAVHPVLNVVAAVLHLLGLATLLASGGLFALLWWRDYVSDRLYGRKGGSGRS
jgi:Zn-dependent protease with chaperone function